MVYVDDMQAPYRGMKMCHMIANTDEELHAMAARIGVQRRWHQAPPRASMSHYDIALSKRLLAIRYGAIPITWRQAGLMAKRQRMIGSLGNPDDVEAWIRALKEGRVHTMTEYYKIPCETIGRSDWWTHVDRPPSYMPGPYWVFLPDVGNDDDGWGYVQIGYYHQGIGVNGEGHPIEPQPLMWADVNQPRVPFTSQDLTTARASALQQVTRIME